MERVSDDSTYTFTDARGNKVPGKRHLNPDGKLGGWVATNAEIHKTAYIHPEAKVGPHRVVKAGEKLGPGINRL